jgi:hypothetical protein
LIKAIIVLCKLQSRGKEDTGFGALLGKILGGASNEGTGFLCGLV